MRPGTRSWPCAPVLSAADLRDSRGTRGHSRPFLHGGGGARGEEELTKSHQAGLEVGTFIFKLF